MPWSVQACLLNCPDTVERRFEVRIQCASLLKGQRASVEDFFAIAPITLSPRGCFSLELGQALGAEWTRSEIVQPLPFSSRSDQELCRGAGVSYEDHVDRPLITHRSKESPSTSLHVKIATSRIRANGIDDCRDTVRDQFEAHSMSRSPRERLSPGRRSWWAAVDSNHLPTR